MFNESVSVRKKECYEDFFRVVIWKKDKFINEIGKGCEGKRKIREYSVIDFNRKNI